MVIANTIVHWAVEWMYYYEIWVSTGKWMGGGHGNWDVEKTETDNNQTGARLQLNQHNISIC